jgi:hypothetical protein
MTRSSRIAAVYLLLTFAAGVAVGGLGFRAYTARSVRADERRPSSEDYRKRYLREMETRLQLSRDQIEKLTSILDATRTLYRELNDKHRPEYRAIHQLQVEQVRSILTDAQKIQYEKLLQERDERRKRSGFPH